MADKPKNKSQRKETGVKMKGSGKMQNQRTTTMENSDRLGTLKEEEGVTTGQLREKLPVKEKKANKLAADEPLGARGKDAVRIREPDCAGLFLDDHSSDISFRTVTKENTYQLGPTKRFPVAAATRILREVLSGLVSEERYEAQRAQQLSLSLSSEIAERVKELGIPRYRLVVAVTVGQVKGQGAHAGSRCLWDATSDTFTSYTFRKGSLFGLASVFAVYLE